MANEGYVSKQYPGYKLAWVNGQRMQMTEAEYLERPPHLLGYMQGLPVLPEKVPVRP